MLILSVAFSPSKKEKKRSGSYFASFFMCSVALSIKMNVLLYAPSLFILMLKAMSISGVISALASAALVQIVLGLPFLLSFPVEYISRAFNLGRVFIHFWSVNFKFVPEPFNFQCCLGSQTRCCIWTCC
ncbi:hypothetical protein ES319_A07G170500v1 [Gossypium barbadense]|uniref:dolichyl-P-Man:Man5GlcNAc2-PP-dolichol alpha-1,3-mannosyltransferase n=1 Tax=Gossypium barbadense TaxID=3634 RepID=A0A5J5V4A9_GOSBA|nr:hypothetical protein ES319_A07G170500v1 [Gossypium barbadense]